MSFTDLKPSRHSLDLNTSKHLERILIECPFFIITSFITSFLGSRRSVNLEPHGERNGAHSNRILEANSHRKPSKLLHDVMEGTQASCQHFLLMNDA